MTASQIPNAAGHGSAPAVERARKRRRAADPARLVLAVVSALGLGAAVPAAALALPDGRAYEMVTPLDKNGIEVGPGIGSVNGNAVDWQSVGGCCGATSSAVTLYRSTRTSGGWQTTSITPKPPTPLVGLFAEQAPVWWSLDLSKTIFTTPASYAAGDQRPAGPGATNYLDLYEEGPTGSMTWLTQGPFPGAGTNPDTATFDGASPNGDHVAFDSPERLTPGATGMASAYPAPQFLYERNAAEGTTNLVNIDSSSLTATAEGKVSATLAATAVGVTPTTLSSSIGPAVSDTLTANATGAKATSLSAPATGAFSTSLSNGAGPSVSTTLASAAASGQPVIPLTSVTGLEPGEQLTIGTGADQETGTIQSIAPPPPLTFSSSFGSSGTAANQFTSPSGVGVNTTSGDVYVADSGNARVEQFSSTGTFTTMWGWGVQDGASSFETCTSACQAGVAGSGAGQFTTPRFIAVDNSGGASSGDVYVADTGTGLVQKFQSNGTLVSSWGANGQLNGSTATNGPFGSIAGIAVDSSGNLWVYNTTAEMFEFGQDGTFVQDFNTSFGVTPVGIAVDSSGNLYIVRGTPVVEKISPSGVDEGQVTSDQPTTGLAIDPSTNDLYVAIGGTSIEKFNSAGTMVGSFGSGNIANAQQLAFNPNVTIAGAGGSGALYAADLSNNDIAIFMPPSAGTPVTLTANLANSHPSGEPVTHSADSEITVASSANFAAGQQISVGGEAATVASVPDGTHVDLATALTNPHAPGETVSYTGDTSITVNDSTGFATGQQITINSGGGDQEAATVASVPNSTTIDLTSGLAINHASGESVTYPGDTTIAVNDTTKFALGETIDLDPSGAQPETATIAAIPSGTQVVLTAPLKFDHASGAPVTYPGDSVITVGDASNFSAGQTITIDPGTAQAETDTIASVPNATTIDLTATVTNPHTAGATVQHAAPDSTLSVASSNGFHPGQTITIDSGGPQETATIASVPDGTHLTLTGPVENNHAAGAPVAYGGDTSITVADSSPFSPGQVLTIYTPGGATESHTISSIPDSATIDLATGLDNNFAVGAAVEAPVNPGGAILGNGNYLAQGFLPADIYGTTTNAVSSDGSKVFFESPPTSAGLGGNPTLYMRDESNQTTTAIAGGAVYVGAAQDGSLVFYGGLSEFNTTGSTIGQAPPMSSFAISDGSGGSVTAISNDGSHVYFISDAALPSNNNAQGQGPTANEPNLYVFDTRAASNATTFIATVSQRDATVLTAQPDIARPAIPTPDGKVLVFDASSNLTGQNTPASTTLAANAAAGDTSVTVTDPTGFQAGQTITIGGNPEKDAITAVSGSTLDLVQALTLSHSTGDPVSQQATFQIYRYATANNSLTCVSCVPGGAPTTGSADLGASGGGSYGPPGEGVPMSSDGSIIFFDSPDKLVAGVNNTGVFPNGVLGSLVLTENVFEWENGHVSLISNGNVTTGATLGSTTPSGNDVFFTTRAQLVPQDADGYDDIYDARVGGGFPAPPATASTPCDSAQSCRSSITPTVFFPLPATSTLIQPNVGMATFSVNSISAKQRQRFAKTGRLTLTVLASRAGTITATASATIHGAKQILSTDTALLFATQGGKAALTVTLSSAARRALARNHRLVVDIAVSYSESSQVNVAAVTLDKSKIKKARQSRVSHRRQSRVSHRRLMARTVREG